MEISLREVGSEDYSEVVSLWNDVLGVRSVTDANFRATMERMNKAGNYKTFVALLANRLRNMRKSTGYPALFYVQE